MLTVVFDASPLITACKFETHGKLVIDHLLSGCHIVIAPSVEEEVAVLGAGYPDGAVAGERIAQGGIQVMPVVDRKWARHLAAYAFGDGERFHRIVWASGGGGSSGDRRLFGFCGCHTARVKSMDVAGSGGEFG